ncbi:protein SODIUM POTASSIUM ROOT DEFECTIVE 2 [Pyrus communis]|uniref:protein SODIUM POTASSIUM ROOT DEFECTIVE 2 n=1 Tax=Pyrus communis TaxID=23211 RepID=UPI0035C24D99
MKGMDIFCASAASTAICSSLDQRAMVRQGLGPLDHRHHYHLRDRDQLKNQPHHQTHHAPCSSQLPIDPKPFYEKCRKSFSSAQSQPRRKSSADIRDSTRTYSTNGSSSSRFLLSDSPFIDWIPKPDHKNLSAAFVPPQVPSKPGGLMSSNGHSNTDLKSSSTRFRHQVVALRVSMHCKGCEGQVRKHLSKMEGVTSFSIDFPTKKVTVMGDVTPSAVLSSVSKVKKAQLWPSPTSSSPSSPSVVSMNHS